MKMWYTYMYCNIKIYQKYLVTSIKVDCATRSLYASSGLKAEGGPTNNRRGMKNINSYFPSVVSFP